MNAELDRCAAEIADAKRELLAGNEDVAGLLLKMKDWAAEAKLIAEGRKDPNA